MCIVIRAEYAEEYSGDDLQALDACARQIVATLVRLVRSLLPCSPFVATSVVNACKLQTFLTQLTRRREGLDHSMY